VTNGRFSKLSNRASGHIDQAFELPIVPLGAAFEVKQTFHNPQSPPPQPATVQMASADFGLKLGSFGDLEVSAWLETAHKRLNLRH
jgi:hypothetical protein